MLKTRCKQGFKTGLDSKSCVPIRFYDQCDPTVAGWDTTQFQLCLFASSAKLSTTPKVADADIDGSALSFVGKGHMPVVSIRTYSALKQYVNKAPADNYAWAIYGMLAIENGGSYVVCSTSSDG